MSVAGTGNWLDRGSATLLCFSQFTSMATAEFHFATYLSALWLQPVHDSVASWLLHMVPRNTSPQCNSQTPCDFSLSYLSS